MKTLFKEIIIISVLTFMITNISISSVYASTVSDNDKNIVNIESVNSTEIDVLSSLIQKGVFNEFEFINNKFKVKSNVNILKNKYNLSFKEVNTINTIINISNQIHTIKEVNTIKSPRIHISNWKIYFTNSDVNGLLLTAATAGPTAMYAVIVSLSTMFAGPIGSVISTIASIIGAASLSRLCYLVIQANQLRKGVYIGIHWNGVFPNYTDGLW